MSRWNICSSSQDRIDVPHLTKLTLLIRTKMAWITIHKLPWTEWTDWVERFCRFHKIFIGMSRINFLFIFSSGLEIFSTLNIHHPVYGCFIHVLYNLTESSIVNYRFGLSSTSSWQTTSCGEKSKLIFKKSI